MIYITERGAILHNNTLCSFHNPLGKTAARMATYRSPKVSTHQSCNTNFYIQFQITLKSYDEPVPRTKKIHHRAFNSKSVRRREL